jgi:16S rRNA G527 N7-methylase RsmG
VKQFSGDTIRRRFLSEVSKWNHVHRIIGSDPQKLLAQSEAALVEVLKSGAVDGNSVWVDVGAGSGIALVPMLWLSPETELVFVEPDKKKMGFLESFFGGLALERPPVLICSKIQFVSRETLCDARKEPAFFARAFSGELDLLKCIRRSEFKGAKWFVFKAEGEKFFFSPLKI